MKALAVLMVGMIASNITVASAQAPAPTIDSLIGAAKNAAGVECSGPFLGLCIPPPPAGAPAPAAAAGARGGARGAAPAPPAKDAWYAEPAKVADNFYFIG